MSFFGAMYWQFMFGMLAFAFYSLMLFFRTELRDVWQTKRAIIGVLVSITGMISALVPINTSVQQLGGIVGIVILIPPARQLWQRLTFEFFDRVAVLGVELGLLGGISVKLMIQGGGFPYYCHILADLLLGVGTYCFFALNKQHDKREQTDTA